ncbi:hypothetical protein V1477_009236 [Vespula maculifrons]|uniref:Uncharacterized protein n=1 Tax=Vespula maculifrons TaxID=7453 RepID=A0ABD2CC50_VESMC
MDMKWVHYGMIISIKLWKNIYLSASHKSLLLHSCLKKKTNDVLNKKKIRGKQKFVTEFYVTSLNE